MLHLCLLPKLDIQPVPVYSNFTGSATPQVLLTWANPSSGRMWESSHCTLAPLSNLRVTPFFLLNYFLDYLKAIHVRAHTCTCMHSHMAISVVHFKQLIFVKLIPVLQSQLRLSANTSLNTNASLDTHISSASSNQTKPTGTLNKQLIAAKWHWNHHLVITIPHSVTNTNDFTKKNPYFYFTL